MTTNTRLTARAVPLGSGFPSNYNFSAPAGTANAGNAVEDQVEVSYGSVTSTTIRFGGDGPVGGNGRQVTQLFGVAFEERGFGSTPTTTTGNPYTLNYSANGGAGTLPANVTIAIGQNLTVATGGNLARSGYTFGGWNTEADGTGTTYPPNTIFTMPQGGATLYAQWVPVPIAAANDTYNCTFNAACGRAAGALFANDFSWNASSIRTVANGLPSVPGALVVNADGSFNFTPSAA